MYKWNTGHFIHCIIHAILFLGFIDFALVFVVFQKYIRNHTTSHKNDMISITILNLSNHFFYYIFSSTIFHQQQTELDIVIFFVEIILLSTNLLQIILGMITQRAVIQTYKYQQIYIRKKIHQIIAVIFVVSGKIKIVLLFVLYLEYLELYLAYLLAIYFFLNVGIYLLVWYTKKKNTYTHSIYYTSLSDQKQLLIQNIQLGYYVDNDSYVESEKLVVQNDSLCLNRSTIFSQFIWIIFENKLYEIKDFDHPGGKFLLKVIKRRDITKIVHGQQSLVIFEDQEQRYKIIHKLHSFRIYNYLDRNCFGQLETFQIFTEQFIQNRNKLLHRKSTIEDVLLKRIFQSSMRKILSGAYSGVRYNKEFLYKCDSKIKISNSNYLLLVEQKETELNKYCISYDQRDNNIYGRNIMLRFKDKSFYFGYAALFLCPNFLRFKEILYQKYSQNFYELYKKLQTPFIQELYMHPDLENQDSGQSNYLPIYIKIQKYFTKLDFHLQIQGQQSIIRQNSLYKYLIIAKNEGIVPFLDFFDQLLLQIIEINMNDQVNESNSNINIFHNILTHGQIKIYWYITQSFKEQAKTFGLIQLKMLDEISQLENYNFLNQVIIQGNKYDTDKYFKNQDLSNYNLVPDFEQIIEKFGEIDKILISADDNFIQKIFHNIKTNYFGLYKIQFV